MILSVGEILADMIGENNGGNMQFSAYCGGATGGFLHTYARTPYPDIKPKLRPAMLILPGGAYLRVSGRESEPIALAFLNEGYSSFVLDYSTSVPYPTQLIEGCMAMAYIRENAAKYTVDVRHVAATGFSAGGHLCCMLAAMYNEKTVQDVLGERANFYRPDAVVLGYPVVSMQNGVTHELTRKIISDDGKVAYDTLSIDKRIGKDSSPAFIWHTFEDEAVSVENSLLLASAYKKANVPFALHVFEKGWHGLSLCVGETDDRTEREEELTYVGKWFSLAIDWLTARGFKVEVVK